MWTRAADGGCRSTTRRTSATRWLVSVGSTSKTSAPESARKRLLNAAKKYRIVPVGFIAGQLRSELELGRAQGRPPVQLPSGFVTMLMTDIEDSTALVQRLGDGYRELIDGVRAILRDETVGTDGHVVEARADEFFAVFEGPRSALDTAVAIQRQLRGRSLGGGLEVRVRIGIHSGYPTLTEENYIGMAVHTAARVCEAAQGSQILVTGDTKEATRVPDPMACASRASVGIACAVYRTRWHCSRSQHRVSSRGSLPRKRPSVTSTEAQHTPQEVGRHSRRAPRV